MLQLKTYTKLFYSPLDLKYENDIIFNFLGEKDFNDPPEEIIIFDSFIEDDNIDISIKDEGNNLDIYISLNFEDVVSLKHLCNHVIEMHEQKKTKEELLNND
jgi:hypothetical protein